ncbi:hypothetical protein V1511DRAFT_257595 [Dipodascopsis uninucleata]
MSIANMVIECSGLPSPNPSVDLCFSSSQDDERVFDKAFQRILDERTRRFDSVDSMSDESSQLSKIDNNALPTPKSEACLSGDEHEHDNEIDEQNNGNEGNDEESDGYPFPRIHNSLFYPDTAPRDSWRPQVESWIRRNHSYKFAEKATAGKPYTIPSKKTAPSKSSGNSNSSPKKNRIDRSHNVHRVDNGLRSPSPSVSPSPSHTHQHKSFSSNHSTPVQHYSNPSGRRCISCGSDQSPCWRPSWSIEAGQLCNSCGLRYKKTGARCLSPSCGRIPAKGEWVTMRSTQSNGRYTCLYCGGGVAVGENSKR